MVSLGYDIDFWLHENFGSPIYADPLEMFGLAIIIGAMILLVILSRSLFKSYRETKEVATLYWFLGFTFLLFAIIFLIVEKLSYTTLGIKALGDFTAIAALISSGTAIVCINFFALYTTYPDRVKILGFFIIILAGIYVGALCGSIILGNPWSNVENFEIIYDFSIDIIVYCTLIPILAIPPVTFFYFSSKTREENKPNSLRALWMGLGVLFFAIGYIVEVAPIFPEILSIPFRTFFIVAAYIMYLCFTMPEWFKNKIGWET